MNDLFELISSLSKSEKRYFKLHNSLFTIGEENNYIKLFDIIEKQKDYNEHKILEQFKGKRLINNFSAAKNHLYNMILRSLNVFHQDISTQLRNNLNLVKVLSNKGLNKQAEILLLKSKKIAHKYEIYPILLDLLNWETGLIMRQGPLGISSSHYDNIIKESYDIVDRIKNLNEFRSVYLRFYYKSYKKGLIRNKIDLIEYKELFNKALFLSEDNAESYEAKVYYYTVYAYYYFLQHDYIHANSYMKKLVELNENNPHFTERNKSLQIWTLVNFFLCQLNLKKYKEMYSTLSKLKLLKMKSETGKQELFLAQIRLELIYYLELGKFQEGVELVKTIEIQLNSLIVKTNTIHNDILNNITLIAHMYFGVKDYSKCIHYLNKIINNADQDLNANEVCFSKIMSLIVFYEKGDKIFLTYAIKSTYRFLLSRKYLYKVEKTILDFIQSKAIKSNSKKEIIDAFIAIKEEFVELSKDPFEKNFFRYMDFVSWIESKIENRSYGEILREKAKAVLRKGE